MYNGYLSYLHISVFPPETSELTMNLGGYSDDIGIHRLEKNNLEQRISILYQKFPEVGFNVNISNSKSVIWNRKKISADIYAESIIKNIRSGIKN